MDDLGLSAAQIDAAGARWTAGEVLQQPQIWAEIAGLIEGQSQRLAQFLNPLLARPDVRVVLTGAGTSAYIGECLAPALARALGRRVDAVPTTDLVASPDSYLSRGTPTLLVSFGRSGSSPESVAAFEIADGLLEHCSHLIFTCDGDGALFRRGATASHAYVVRLPEACNDRSFAMTSSFTGMLLAAALALRALPPAPGRSSMLAALAAQVLPGTLSLLQNLVSGGFERAVYLGAKEFKGLAREAALKMLELTDGKVVAVADSPLGFRHGPKTILNAATLVVVFVGNDPYARQYDVDLIRELRRDAVAGRVIAIAAADGLPAHADNLLLESSRARGAAADLELCLPYAMFAQSLALLRSISLGIRPDNPNAAGTVSRVVKGVSIHCWQRGA
ncbi:MAG: SIS domain-containing protein [Steroidobacteraceae bacterium]